MWAGRDSITYLQEIRWGIMVSEGRHTAHLQLVDKTSVYQNKQYENTISRTCYGWTFEWAGG